ncbi:MAG: hypothetical protein PUP92_40470 [Rhizonema sp. PD38]|nr:hypothetical protein [Rhizonema sp. PD38]
MSNFYQSRRSLGERIFSPQSFAGINICSCCPYIEEESDEESPYPPFTGVEFLNTHDTIDEHPYTTAFSKFLAIGIDSDTANELAFGIHSAIGFISDDFEDPLRQTAVDIFDQFSDMGYWRDLGDTDSEPNGFDAYESK